MTPAVYLIPSSLGGPPLKVLPPSTVEIVREIRHFAVENARSARAFLAALGLPCTMRELSIEVLSGNDDRLLAPVRAGQALGVLAEAGCPGVADPGQALVAAAHLQGMRVVPLVGPSSILLALMASGLEGQRFAFCGYVPREREARRQRIRGLELRSRQARETQAIIETPYRSDALLADLLSCCAPKSRLCVAVDLTLPTEEIRTCSVEQWRSAPPSIGKRPAVFLLLA